MEKLIYIPHYYIYIQGDDNFTCCICLDDFITGDYIANLHCTCTIKIHWICFEQHKEYHNDCPICHTKCIIDTKKNIFTYISNFINIIFSSE